MKKKMMNQELIKIRLKKKWTSYINKKKLGNKGNNNEWTNEGTNVQQTGDSNGISGKISIKETKKEKMKKKLSKQNEKKQTEIEKWQATYMDYVHTP